MTFEEYQKQWALRDFERAKRAIYEWRETAARYHTNSTYEELYKACCSYMGPTVFIPFDLFKETLFK